MSNSEREELLDRARMVAMREQYGGLIPRLIDIFAETTPAAGGLERLLELFAPTVTALRDAAGSDAGRAHELL